MTSASAAFLHLPDDGTIGVDVVNDGEETPHDGADEAEGHDQRVEVNDTEHLLSPSTSASTSGNLSDASILSLPSASSSSPPALIQPHARVLAENHPLEVEEEGEELIDDANGNGDQAGDGN